MEDSLQDAAALLSKELDELIPLEDFKLLTARIRKSFQDKFNIKSVVSLPVLCEVRVNTLRSLSKKLPMCQNGFNAVRKAGFFCFWAGKLKPFVPLPGGVPQTAINEYYAIALGAAIVNQCLGIHITLEPRELEDTVRAIRMHTSSPHSLTQLFSAWVSREERSLKK